MGIQNGRSCGGSVIYVKAFIIDGDTGEQGRFDVGSEMLRTCLRVFGVGYDKGFPHTGLCDSLDQVIVDRAADAEGEEAGGVHIAINQFEYFLFVGNVAVGDDDNAPGSVLMQGDAHGFFKSRHHGGSAAALCLVDQVYGAVYILAGGGQGLRRQGSGIIRKQNQVESVGFP